MADFDPYYTWLGISPQEQPPNHYRLLGLGIYESNLDVIANAADRQMQFVRQFQLGEHRGASQELLDEIAIAKLCLLSPTKKAQYDHTLGIAESTPVLAPRPVRPMPRHEHLANRQARSVMQAPPKAVHVTQRPVRKKRPRRGGNIVRLAGHILAPLVGLGAGWLILQAIQPNQLTPPPANTHRRVVDESDGEGIDLNSYDSSDEASSATSFDSFRLDVGYPIAEPESRESQRTDPIVEPHFDPTLPATASDKERMETLRKQMTASIADGDLRKALEEVRQMAQLEIGPAETTLQALQRLVGSAASENEFAQIAELAVTLLERETGAGRQELIQQLSELAIIAARKSNRSETVRAATLAVLKGNELLSEAIEDN